MADIRTIVHSYPFELFFQMTRLRDADTIEGLALAPVSLDIPFLGVAVDTVSPLPMVVRLEGVDAFEKNTPEGKRAIDHAQAWFASVADDPANDVWLHTAGKRDNFGRLLGDLRMSPDHLSGLAWSLLEAGFAVPYKRHVPW